MRKVASLTTLLALVLTLFFISPIPSEASGGLDTWGQLPPTDQSGFPSGIFRAIAISGSNLYVGGSFCVNLSCNDENIVRLNTVTNTWSTLPNNGLNDQVFAMVFHGSDLYVGGRFTATKDGSVTSLNHVARFDTLTDTWYALPNGGLDSSEVYSMVFVGNDLYVAGAWFTKTYDGTVTDLNNIARLDTDTGIWYALPNTGLSGLVDPSVYALAVNGSQLYVGGAFTQTADGSITNLHGIARLDTGTDPAAWYPLPNDGLNDEVDAMAFSGPDLYVGGLFTSTHDGSVINLNSIARFDTTGNTWLAFPHNGLFREGELGPIAAVGSLGLHGNDLYIGGQFSRTTDNSVTNLNDIALFDTDTDTWSALPNNGLNGNVIAFALDGNVLYVGGQYSQTADGALQLNGIARLFEDLAPTDIFLSNSDADGDQPAGTSVGTLSSSDPNIGDTFTYAFCGGMDDNSFQAAGDILQTAAVFNYSTKSSYSICVRSIDSGGLSFDKDFTVTVNPTFRSASGYDGWILESGENSNIGGTLNVKGTSFNLGDDDYNRQYRGILSFDTSGLPDNAVISRAKLQIRYQKQVGYNAFLVLGEITVDIFKGSFSNNVSLQLGDFQATASKKGIGFLANDSRGADWYSINLSATAIPYINRKGVTQFRLRFQKDDNNDHVVNYLQFYSGNASASSKPILIIEYTVP